MIYRLVVLGEVSLSCAAMLQQSLHGYVPEMARVDKGTMVTVVVSSACKSEIRVIIVTV